MQCSFYKKRKRTRERFVLLKRMQKNARTLRSFEKNGCPILADSDSAQANTAWSWTLRRLTLGGVGLCAVRRLTLCKVRQIFLIFENLNF